MNNKNAIPNDLKKQIFDLLMKKAPNNFDTTDQVEIDFMLSLMALIRSDMDEFERYIVEQFFPGSTVLNHFDQIVLDYQNGQEVPLEYVEFINRLKKGVPVKKMNKSNLLIAERIIDCLLAQQ